MADSGFDGSVKIDTRISDKGFNAGMKKIQAAAVGALNNVLFATLKVGDKVRAAFDGVMTGVGKVAQFMKKVLLGGLLVFGASIAAMFRGIRESFTSLLQNNLKGTQIAKDIEEISGKFTELKYSIVAAFLPLIQVAVPYIKIALDWLTKLFNNIAIITAAWLGQKNALQILPGSAAKLAKETDKTKKAAQGALAAFDQINVLQKQSTEDTATSPQVETNLVPITPEVLEDAKAKLGELKDKALELLSTIAENAKNSFLDFIYWDKWVAFVKEKWQEFKDFIFLDNWLAFFTNVWDKIKNAAAVAWDFIKTVWTTDVEFIKGLWATIAPFFQAWWDTIVSIFQERIQFIHDIIQSIKEVFNGLIMFITGIFTGDWQKAWDGLVMVFKGIWDGIYAFIKLSVNSWIDVLNGLIRAVVLGVNTMITALNSLQISIPDWVPEIGGGTLGFNIATITAPQIPRLASGAVIPPNSEFLAVLGDQKSGTNIEAPADLIRQIMREELSGSDASVTVPVYLDGEKIFQNQQRIQRKHGKNLISAGTV